MFRFQSINQVGSKIKAIGSVLHENKVYGVISLVLACVSVYFIVQIMALRAGRPPVTIGRFTLENSLPAASVSTTTNISNKKIQEIPVDKTSKQVYVASKSGKKYHLPTCAGARTISEKNKIWFSTKLEAEKAGYTPAGNCKGI